MGQKGRPSPKETRGAAASAAAAEKAESAGSGPTAKSNSGVGNKKGGNARGADSKGSHKLGASKAGGGRKGDQPKKPSGQQRGQALHRHTLGALQPVQQKTHWDYVLTEMKWMATDFMQERRWKTAAGAHMSHAIRESGKVKVVEECEDTETVVNSSENGDTEPSRSKKDTEKGPEGASDAAPADSGRKDRSEDPDEPGTPPKASEPSSWCLHYELTRDLKKAFMAHISEMDDQRALAQDLRYHEYLLDYDAACVSVTLGHQVAKTDAARLAAEELQQAERARLEAEEQIRKNKRLKKKSTKALENMDTVDEDNSLLAGLASTPRVDSVDVDAPQQRKKDKKKKKKGDEDSEMTDPSMDKGLKRSASGMEAAAKGLERKHSKKIKSGKAGAGDGASADGKGRLKKGTIMPGDLIAWTAQEDQLLFAIVHEFGANWVLVADVLSSGSALQGVFRRPDQCKSRWKALTQQTADGNGSEPTLSSLKLTKGAAREVLTSAMPVPELVLNRQISTLSKVSLRLITSLEEDRKRKMEANGQRHMIHASHGNIEMKCLQANGQKLMTPLELAGLANQVVPPNSNNLVAAAQQPSGPLPAAAAQQAQPQQVQAQPAVPGAATTQAGAVQPLQQQMMQPAGMGAQAPVQGMLPPGQQPVHAMGVSGAMTAGSSQLLPQVMQQAASNQQMVAGSAQNPAAIMQARQQLQAHVAAIAQQRGLTPAQHQALLTKVTQQAAQQQAQRMAQQASQGMSPGVASQPMQMQQAAAPGAVLSQGMHGGAQQGAMLMQAQQQPVASGSGVMPPQQQQQQQQMAGMALQPGMMQQPQMMGGQQMPPPLQQQQMAMASAVSQGQLGVAQAMQPQQTPTSAPGGQQQQQRPGSGPQP
mmetsp:Transcript_12681/g.32615  ORF Transcript_12681/g.32615 Transcript_12681/m.32615 type:complete len:876 (-) Transcript_12681:141-2768(-)|eukprot:jgi/Tetstr1/444395/TSEL_032285.t1